MRLAAAGRRAGLAAATALLLTACNGDADAPEAEAEEEQVPEELASEPLPDLGDIEAIGTPMEERVATLGVINKRNNISQDIELSPGDTRRVDDVVVRLSACERTAPWESPSETGAFVQVFVNEVRDPEEEPEFTRIFSGWLFKNSPSLNVVEHPIYDVWVKDCAMSFPGEE
ncbi:DUF2155 domain-containing protein [Aurantiacibacter poecillastricola]|uniref:DUF2155 domain-containing protein n=1 Tax=Aurantiacibacter poecillastricola TaxID=3064385 RepID=UPI00273E94E4|nr:DUF2155 domain-containing protein [Aurantiacibacter sp. 219JJ12-13]MDP5260102.1 DUF2155 domain-containing protein [Aurantiacibacter sp. 219JJ12-13]